MHDPFPTTQWTAFFALRDSADPEGRRFALAHLYERYWQPLYVYLRRRGFDQDQSADLLQGFFTHLLERAFVDRLDLSGRLRAFLIAALKNYLSHEREKAQALRRNPGPRAVSLDIEAAETAFREIPSAELTPDQVYEQRWALEMMSRARQRLARSEERAGRSELFARIADSVYGDAGTSSYAEIAQELDVSEPALRVRVHRLRKRLGRLLREDIALTVSESDAIDDELRHLVALTG